jgi:hypothetical protein
MSCKIYPPIKNVFLPHQFGPYKDVDPNSIIKYKNPNYISSYPIPSKKIDILTWLKEKNTIEQFDNHNQNLYPFVLSCLIIVIFIFVIING